MNSKRSNEKIIQILSEMQPIHEETDEEREHREKMAEEAIKKAIEDYRAKQNNKTVEKTEIEYV